MRRLGGSRTDGERGLPHRTMAAVAAVGCAWRRIPSGCWKRRGRGENRGRRRGVGVPGLGVPCNQHACRGQAQTRSYSSAPGAKPPRPASAASAALPSPALPPAHDPPAGPLRGEIRSDWRPETGTSLSPYALVHGATICKIRAVGPRARATPTREMHLQMPDWRPAPSSVPASAVRSARFYPSLDRLPD